jgi:ubiquinone biosynthesis protein Coq4
MKNIDRKKVKKGTAVLWVRREIKSSHDTHHVVFNSATMYIYIANCI